MGVLDDIQKWYASNCDDYWEHDFGMQIGTLDNPGWDVTIDLEGTNLDGRKFETFEAETSEERWIHCRIEENKFRGFGDETKLEEILKVFLDWAKSQNENWLNPSKKTKKNSNSDLFKKIK